MANHDVKTIRMTCSQDRKTVLFHVLFRDNARQPIDLTFDAGDVMALMVALQKFQIRHHISIPPNLRPQGTPVLSIVSDDDGLDL